MTDNLQLVDTFLLQGGFGLLRCWSSHIVSEEGVSIGFSKIYKVQGSPHIGPEITF